MELPERSVIGDWLVAHRELMAAELSFTDLALRAAMGEAAPEDLDRERRKLLALRELCNVVYIKAFPESQGKPAGDGLRVGAS